MSSRDSSQIKGDTEVFINGEGHKISWWVEAADKGKPPPLDTSSSKFGRHKEDDEEEEGDDSGGAYDGSHDSRLPNFCRCNNMKILQIKNLKEVQH